MCSAGLTVERKFFHSREALGKIEGCELRPAFVRRRFGRKPMHMQLWSAALLIADVVKVFNPQSPQARAIFNLTIVVIVVMAMIFAVVVGIVTYALFRFPRWREGERDPDQGAGNKTIEIVWTAIPLLIVTILFVFAARTMGISDPPPPPNPDILVIGHQWWWEARYSNSGVIVANEIHIPVGKPLALRLDSADVLHEFWVPELSRKMTTVPGHPNHIWIQADKPGTYLGFCSEFCGTSTPGCISSSLPSRRRNFRNGNRHNSSPRRHHPAATRKKGSHCSSK